MNEFQSTEHPHRRHNPLKNEWVLVSPHRTKRPWQGKEEESHPVSSESYLADCYLCPGNKRINGEINPRYSETFVFNNDFAAVMPDTPYEHQLDDTLFMFEAVKGTSRVICYSPDHSKTMPEMSVEAISKVIETWCQQFEELGKDYAWVQIFENKGQAMGCSNPHPHGQVWATDFIPVEAEKANRNQQAYFGANNSSLLLDYAKREAENEERTVVENKNWIAVVPYWAAWPFEILLLPKFSCHSMLDLDKNQQDELASILKSLTTRYDNLFQCSFPYSMGWHAAPSNLQMTEHWQLHCHFYPPLLRSATVKKFMVGYEMMAEPQRDLTPEQAAQLLRTASEVHYKACGEVEK